MRTLSLGILAALALSLASSRAGDRPATAPTSAPTTARTSTNGFGPITYYEEHCSRCHGQFGTGYLPDMDKRLTDDALRKVILEMAEGPAAAPLDEAQLDAEMAYHRSFIDGTPFVARTDAKALKGEVTEGARVSVVVNGKTIPASVEGHTWSVNGAGSGDARIIAEHDGKRTTLEPGKPFSHGKPAR